jgi:hypothetical protein
MLILMKELQKCIVIIDLTKKNLSGRMILEAVSFLRNPLKEVKHEASILVRGVAD